MRCLEIIGEATSKISTECKALYPQVAWKEMKELRNKVIHHYEGLIYEIIIDVVLTKLPYNWQRSKKSIWGKIHLNPVSVNLRL